MVQISMRDSVFGPTYYDVKLGCVGDALREVTILWALLPSAITSTLGNLLPSLFGARRDWIDPWRW